MKYSHLTHDEFERIAHADAATELELEFVRRWADIKEEESDRSMELLGEQLSESQQEIQDLKEAVEAWRSYKVHAEKAFEFSSKKLEMLKGYITDIINTNPEPTLFAVLTSDAVNQADAAIADLKTLVDAAVSELEA
jgi:phosphoglycolate phosphatase-like HAD superfamily hydrolase